MRKRFTFVLVLVVISALLLGPSAIFAQDKVTITVAVVNNPDQRRLLDLSDQFRAAYPNIDLSFVMLNLPS